MLRQHIHKLSTHGRYNCRDGVLNFFDFIHSFPVCYTAEAEATSFLHSSCSHPQVQTVPSSTWDAPCPVVTPSLRGSARHFLLLNQIDIFLLITSICTNAKSFIIDCPIFSLFISALNGKIFRCIATIATNEKSFLIDFKAVP